MNIQHCSLSFCQQEMMCVADFQIHDCLWHDFFLYFHLHVGFLNSHHASEYCSTEDKTKYLI